VGRYTISCSLLTYAAFTSRKYNRAPKHVTIADTYCSLFAVPTLTPVRFTDTATTQACFVCIPLALEITNAHLDPQIIFQSSFID